MRSSGILVAAAAVLLLAAAPVLAAPGSLSGRMALPLEVHGQHAAQAADGDFVLQGADGAVSFLLQDAQGQVERVIHRAYGYVNPNDPQFELTWHDEVDRETLPLAGSLLTIAERLDGFTLLGQGGVELATGPRGGALLTGLLDTPRAIEYQLDRQISVRLQPPSDDDRFREVLEAGLYQSRALDGRATLRGPFDLFLSDAVLEYFPAGGASQTLPVHFRIEERPGALYNPLTGGWSGPGTHQEYVQEYVLLHVATGRLDLQFADLAGFLYAPAQSVAVEGTAFLPAVRGEVLVEDADGKAVRHQLRGEDLELSGRFALQLASPDRAGATTAVSGDGDFTYVAYGTVSEAYDWTQVATAVGLGAALLAAVAWVATQAKTLLGAGAAVAGYARVQGHEVLEHPGRSQVYEMVKSNPGVSFMELARSLGLGESTLTYHVRVLERNGFVTAVKDGRYLRYFDRQSGTYARERKVLVSALRNRTTAAIAQEIQRRPGVAQRDLAEAFRIAPSTVNWHIRRLSGVGLVSERRDHPHTRYYLGEAWASLPAEEQARLQTAIAATA